MRTAYLVMGLAAMLSAQETGDALRLLEASARKYQDIGSYESHAIARRPLGEGLVLQVQLEFAYASAKMTPPDLPVPMLPQAVRMGPFDVLDEQGNSAKVSRSLAGPGPAFSFERMAWRVTSSKITGTETVNSHMCEMVDVQYEDTRQNPKGEPVRYWIELATGRIWKMQFSELDPFSKSGGIARWTVVWDSWTEDQAPPTWVIDFSKDTIPAERAALIGHEAPEIVGRSLSGQSFQLSKLKGTVVVLDFWGTWCGPCAEEMASLERLKESLPGKAVEIWSISEDNPEAAKRWLVERRRKLPTAIVEAHTAFRVYGIDALPQILVIDRGGIVAHHWVGLKSEKDLRQAIEVSLDR